MRHSFLFFILSLSLIALAGCETVKGVGRDITGASTTVQDSFSNSARKNR